MTETLLVQNLAYIRAVYLEGEWFLYLLSVLRNMSYKWEKIFRHFFIHFFAQKTKSEKNFDANFERKCSLWNACKLHETMDTVFGPGSEK